MSCLIKQAGELTPDDLLKSITKIRMVKRNGVEKVHQEKMVNALASYKIRYVSYRRAKAEVWLEEWRSGRNIVLLVTDVILVGD